MKDNLRLQQEELWKVICVRQHDESTGQYYWMWRFATEMPKDGRESGRWERAMEVLYWPGGVVPMGGGQKGRTGAGGEDGGVVKRSCEMIYRSWGRMEKDEEGRDNVLGRAVIARFRSEFDELLAGGNGTALGLVGDMVPCPRAEREEDVAFWMGSPVGEAGRDFDERRHRVIVTPFMLGRYCVTVEEYELFDPAIRGRLIPEYMPRNKEEWGRCPVTLVDWYQSWVFAKWLGEGYGLPREAEWEYGCRAGSKGSYCFGEDPNGELLKDYAWYGPNSGGRVHPVGGKRPNKWGLYDMHGNVWEWCEDWYGPYAVSKKPVTDPTGPATCSFRVSRGGCWWSFAQFCRSASRSWSWYDPGYRSDSLGFRFALRDVRLWREQVKKLGGWSEGQAAAQGAEGRGPGEAVRPERRQSLARGGRRIGGAGGVSPLLDGEIGDAGGDIHDSGGRSPGAR